jgi:hypothetical protein
MDRRPMTWRGKRRGGLRRVEGSKFAEMGVLPVYVCDRCGTWQLDLSNRPIKPGFFCIASGCSGTTFTKFGSKGEAQCFANLRLRAAAGEFSDIKLQVRFPLHAVGPDKVPQLVWTYVADFTAVECKTGQRVVFEAKSALDTKESQIKRKHCEIEYGVTIRMISP